MSVALMYLCILSLDTEIHGRSQPERRPGESVRELHRPEGARQSRPAGRDPGSGGQPGELVFFIWPA